MRDRHGQPNKEVKYMRICILCQLITFQSYLISQLLVFVIPLAIKQMSSVSRFCRWSRKALKKFDLFPTNNFVRYNGDSEYTTATGGFVSIAVIIIFIVMFANMALKTIDKKIITSSVQKIVDFQPPTINIQTSKESNFMFAISLMGFDLSDPYLKLFNITLSQAYYGPGYKLINQTLVPLVSCTAEHFSFGKDIQDLYYKFNMTQSLCPPLGYNFSVGGKPISDLSSLVGIVVERCNATLDPYCANSTVFNSIESKIQQFTLVVPVINVQLNPASTDYKSYYLQDRNYFKFDSNLGNNAFAYLEQIAVKTDVSITPFADIQTQYFTVLPQTFTNVPYYKNAQRPFAQIMFSKSASTTTYSRSFNKIDAYFAYVGGLVGTIIGLIFILNTYTQKAYEISISHKLFKDAKGKDINSSSFNFMYYLAMTVKGILSCFCCRINWPKTDSFIQCCQQINYQLDICYILKKIIFLQSAVEVLFKQEQLSTLHLKNKQSIQAAKQRRRKYFGTEIIGNDSLMKIHVENHNIENKDQFCRQSEVGNDVSMQSQQEAQFQKSSQILQNKEDFSVISFTRRSRDRKDYEENLNKVLRDVQKGDRLSKRIVKHVDSRYYSDCAINGNLKEQVQNHQIVFEQRSPEKMKQPKESGIERHNFDFSM